MSEFLKKLKDAEKRQAAHSSGRDPKLPRYFSGQLANENRQAYYDNLPTDYGDPLQDSAGNLIPIPGIDT